MTPEEARESIKQAVLSYGRAMATGDELLIQLAGKEAMRRIESAIPDKATLESVGS